MLAFCLNSMLPLLLVYSKLYNPKVMITLWYLLSIKNELLNCLLLKLLYMMLINWLLAVLLFNHTMFIRYMQALVDEIVFKNVNPLKVVKHLRFTMFFIMIAS